MIRSLSFLQLLVCFFVIGRTDVRFALHTHKRDSRVKPLKKLEKLCERFYAQNPHECVESRKRRYENRSEFYDDVVDYLLLAGAG